VKGFLGAAPSPKTVKISDLTLDMVSTLLRIEDLQFSKCDAGKVFADAEKKVDINRTMESCVENTELYLRSSAYSDFAIQKTPTGSGSVVGILGIYSTNNQVAPSDFQFYVRDTKDLSMESSRCDAAIGGELTNISDIRSQFTGTTTTVSGSKKIKGIVISDRANNNLNARNLYLQDGSGGIVVRFTENHCYDLGDEIEVDVSGQELSEFQKLLQVNNQPFSKSQVVGTGKSIEPRIATIAEINTNFDAWESTLVYISNATVAGGATISGSATLNDGTGSLTMFTSAAATFSSTPRPTGTVKITAIVSDFNGKQVLLRNAGDIQQ
jgi:hypothetical protein